MPEIKFFPETHVVFVSEIGPYKKTVPRGFKRLYNWLDANAIKPVGSSLAILYDDPARVPGENQRCDLCAPVGPSVTGSGEVRTKEIGGWKVAAINYEGEKNAQKAYNQVYDWLRDQGYAPADVPVVKYGAPLGENGPAQVGVPVIRTDLMPGSKKTKREPLKQVLKARTATRKTAGRPAVRKTTKRTAR